MVSRWFTKESEVPAPAGSFRWTGGVVGMLWIYGLLSNLVASRVREIGVHMVIGVPPAAIGKLVLWQRLLPVAAGLAVG